MFGANAQPQLLKCRQRVDPALGIDPRWSGCCLPVGSLKEIQEIDAEGLFSLPDLPVLAGAGEFELLTEMADLLGERRV